MLNISFLFILAKTYFIYSFLFWLYFLCTTNQFSLLTRIFLLFQDFNLFSSIWANVLNKMINFMLTFDYLYRCIFYLQNWIHIPRDFLVLICFYIILLHRPYSFIWIYKLQEDPRSIKNDFYLNNRLYFFYLFYFIKKTMLFIFILILIYFFFLF